MIKGFVWTEENTAKLISLQSKGASAAEIALTIGAPSRNAVLGKLHRLWIRAIKQNSVGGRPRKSDRVKASALVAKLRNISSPPELKAGKFKERVASVEPLHIGLLELAHDSCRWPYGNGPFTFCGCPALFEKPYCAAHDEISRPKEVKNKPKKQYERAA